MRSLQGLRFGWNDGTPLIFPDFEAPQGARVVVHGRSGSGKSTLLALVAGALALALASAARPAWRAARLDVTRLLQTPR